MKKRKKLKAGIRPRPFRKSFELYLKFGEKRRGIHTGGYSDKQLQIKRILWLCGGQMNVMRRLNVSRSCISRWIERETIPAKYFQELCAMTDGRLTVPMIAAVIID